MKTTPASAFRSLISVVTVVVMGTASSQAADLYWDPNGAAAETGGTGNWSATGTWRADSGSGTLGDWVDGNVAVLGGISGTVSINSGTTISLPKINLTSALYKVSGSGTVAFGAAGLIELNTTNGLDFSSNATGSLKVQSTGNTTTTLLFNTTMRILSGTNLTSFELALHENFNHITLGNVAALGSAGATVKLTKGVLNLGETSGSSNLSYNAWATDLAGGTIRARFDTGTWNGATSLSANSQLMTRNAANVKLVFSTSATINLNVSTLNLMATPSSAGIELNGVISGSGNLATLTNALGTTDTGSGTTTLTASNTYTGTTSIAVGVINIRNAAALGGGSGGTTVAVGAGLELQGGINVAAETLTLAGGGLTGAGGLRSVSGNNSWGGNISMGASTVTRIASTADLLTITGNVALTTTATDNLVLQGAGNLTLSGVISGASIISSSSNGSGIRTLSGENIYTGQTRINGGTLVVSSLNRVIGGSSSSSLGAPVTAADGTITLGVAGGVPAEGTLRYVGSGETTDRELLLNADAPLPPNLTAPGGVLDHSGSSLLKFTGNVSAVAGSSKSITLTGSTAGTGEISGIIGNPADSYLVSVLKKGSGSWVLSGSNTYTGNTTVENGVLSISNTYLADSSTLTIGSVTASPAVLHLPNAGTDVVAVLIIDGVVQADGIYDSASSGGAITGAGKIQVGVGSSFSTWIGTFTGLGDITPGGDPDSDGMDNLLEFVLNGDPGASDNTILPDLTVTATDFEFTFTRHDGSLAGTTQKFQYATNLTTWTEILLPAASGTVGTATITVTDAGTTDTVKVSIPKTEAVNGMLFGRLQVAQP